MDGDRRFVIAMTLVAFVFLGSSAYAGDVEPPIRAPAPHHILKNRYISIDPRGAGQTNPSSHHIRVMVETTEINGHAGFGPWWANQPVNGGGLSPATCISIVTTTKPAVEPDWSACPIVHLTGCPIVPTTTYFIAIEADGVLSAAAFECRRGGCGLPQLAPCDPANGDADCNEAEGETCQGLGTQVRPGVKWHGDIVGYFDGEYWSPANCVASIDDTVAAIKTFQDPGAFNATHLSVTDVHPNLNGTQINLIVNIADVFVLILGFQGFEYPGPDLTQCP